MVLYHVGYQRRYLPRRYSQGTSDGVAFDAAVCVCVLHGRSCHGDTWSRSFRGDCGTDTERLLEASQNFSAKVLRRGGDARPVCVCVCARVRACVRACVLNQRVCVCSLSAAATGHRVTAVEAFAHQCRASAAINRHQPSVCSCADLRARICVGAHACN